jgi:K(+)-stimulated pyrophosphate-energized sodium pump
MRQIAGAIQEGAKAYLKRQILTIGAIAIVIFVLLAALRDLSTAIGF